MASIVLLPIDRHRVNDLGLNVGQIGSAVETAVGGTQAGDYRDGGAAIRILVRLKDADTLTSELLLDLRVGNGAGSAGVPLRSVVEIEKSTAPMLIERQDQQRFVSVAANVADRDMGSIAADVQLALAEIPLPAGYSFVIAGDFQEQQDAFRELMLTLFLSGSTFNVQSYIGCIVVNNAILFDDQDGRLRREGLDTQAAVAEAGRRRPILMTTLTTILGLQPLAQGVGEGAEAQAPLARAVIGGLATSTLITLVLIPALYSLVHARDKQVAAP